MNRKKLLLQKHSKAKFPQKRIRRSLITNLLLGDMANTFNDRWIQVFHERLDGNEPVLC